jgi:hypothetical protein
MKWTTTIDFLEFMTDKDWRSYDHVILYTGIVDWSPRPQKSAISDLYNNQAPENLENIKLNTADYGQKVVNNKKALFDDIFGAERVGRHLNTPFDVRFEDTPTINMYDLEMASEALLPRLSAIENLIFVNSNRFVPGWKGDHKRGRPENITITEKFSELFLDALRGERVVDLLKWNPSEIQRYTCDNMHLTKQGSDWIYERLIERMSALGPFRQRPFHSAISVEVDRNSNTEQLSRLNSALGNNESVDKFFDGASRSTKFYLGEEIVEFGQYADQRYLGAFSPLYSDDEVGKIANLSQSPLDGVEIANRELSLFYDAGALDAYLEAKTELFRWRYTNEYKLVRPISTEFFPYNYVSAYAYRFFDGDGSTGPKKVVFIYCIKNRRIRTNVSIRSMIASLKTYRERGGGSLQIQVMVVEDVSDDVFDFDDLGTDIEIDHILVDTGVAWTRSGLLNVGIREASGDLVAFVDADFLFHDTFFCSLENVLNKADWRKHVFAANLIETETHTKNETIYSACSPYSYMWIAPLDVAVDVTGFDEGYTGHGSEDRDFELKLTKLGGLTVTDSLSLDPDCFVFHLSHNSRDGIEQHQINRKRYLARLAETDVTKLRQEKWGETKITRRTRNIEPSKPNVLNGSASLAQPINPEGTCYMVISCVPYAQRRRVLKRWYEQIANPFDKVVFVVGGADHTYLDERTNTLHLKCGDMYEDLPEKVLQAFLYIHEHFNFRHVVKVDDDVIINFDVLRNLLTEMDAPYFGKMIPSRRGAKPSETWHFDKVSEKSRHYQRPFSFEGGPSNWACGGMYCLRHDGLRMLAQNAMGVDARDFLYEDHMIGSMLHKSGVEALFIEETPGLEEIRFIETDLRKLMTDDLGEFETEQLEHKIGGIHCGPFPPYYQLSQDRSLDIMGKCMNELNRLFLPADVTSGSS